MGRSPGEPRVISLSPGATATIHALGRSDVIVSAEPTVVFRDSDADRLRPYPSRPHVYTLRPRTVAEALGTIKTVGDAIGASAEAHVLLHRLRVRLDNVALGSAKRRWWPRMAVLKSSDRLLACGRWVPELVGLAGAVDVLGIARGADRVVDWAAIARSRPDVVVVLGLASPPTGRSSMRLVDADPSTIAVAGPRLIDGLEWLAAIARQSPRSGRRK
jgi:iron complex transport system substrate-binding protein